MEAKIPTGAEKLIQCLEREGVEYIFGYSGGAAMPIFDALVDSDIEQVAAICALFNVIVRLADSLEFDVPPAEFLEKMAPMMLKRGYK